MNREVTLEKIILTLKALIQVLETKKLIHSVTASTLMDMISKEKK